MIAGHPVAHKEGHYRCSLPDLAGFMILCCTGPGYQNRNLELERKKRGFLTDTNPLPFSERVLYLFQTVSSRKLEGKEMKDNPETDY